MGLPDSIGILICGSSRTSLLQRLTDLIHNGLPVHWAPAGFGGSLSAEHTVFEHYADFEVPEGRTLRLNGNFEFLGQVRLASAGQIILNEWSQDNHLVSFRGFLRTFPTGEVCGCVCVCVSVLEFLSRPCNEHHARTFIPLDFEGQSRTPSLLLN